VKVEIGEATDQESAAAQGGGELHPSGGMAKSLPQISKSQLEEQS
jgi:hypothetical protein